MLFATGVMYTHSSSNTIPARIPLSTAHTHHFDLSSYVEDQDFNKGDIYVLRYDLIAEWLLEDRPRIELV